MKAYRGKNSVARILKNPFNNLSMLPARFHTTCYCNFGGFIDTPDFAGPQPVTLIIRLNSLHNPYSSALFDNSFMIPINTSWVYTTASPYGLARFLGQPNAGTAPYQNYRVYASEVIITAVANDQTDNFIMTVVPCDSNSLVLANAVDYTYQSQAPNRRVSKVAVHDTNQVSVRNYATAARTLGITKRSVQDNDTTAATAGAEPSALAIWLVNLFKTNGTEAWERSVSIKIRVKYWIELFGLNEFTQSITE